MTHRPATIAGTASLALAATGVVFGDIGTSPLYALKSVLAVSGTDETAVLGVVSLVFWAMMLVVTVKYLTFVMRADNHGEGGILALLALLPGAYKNASSGRRRILLVVVLAGTALLFADGALTPAISVLSATEGIAVINADAAHYAVPATVVILTVLYAIQRTGTTAIGRVFGPVMLTWFLAIGGLGAWHVASDLSVLRALSPTYAISYLATHPGLGLAIGAVVILAVTGAEALYADMGHFGIRPIRWAWIVLVAPTLVACYLGQAAVVLADPTAAEDPFFALAPNHTIAIGMVVLATAATVIASQALITGVFSLARQGVQLGLLPRLTIKHTSTAHEGQIYVPLANILLAIGSITLVLTFQSSTALAAAYVLAIAGTMSVTTLAFWRVTRDVWKWGRVPAGLLAGGFALIDLAFLAATITTVLDGGWVPVALAIVILAIMLNWRTGQRLLARHVDEESLTWDAVVTLLDDVPRPVGEAVYLASHPEAVPSALASAVRLVGNVPQRVTVVHVRTEPVPTVDLADSLHVDELGAGVRLVTARVGFDATVDVPQLLAQLPDAPNLATVVYYVSDRTFLATKAGRMGHFAESLFAFMHRNAARPTSYFGLPDDRVVSLTTHLDL